MSKDTSKNTTAPSFQPVLDAKELADYMEDIWGGPQEALDYMKKSVKRLLPGLYVRSYGRAMSLLKRRVKEKS